MANTTVSLGNGQRQTFPFMKLPPELRLIVYELAMRSYLEEIDRTKFLQCGPPELGVSAEAENKRQEAMTLEKAEIVRKRDSKAAPYLGVLALLHTSKMVCWESYDIMSDLAKCHYWARSESMKDARMHILSWDDMQSRNLLEYEYEVMTAIWSFMVMVSKSFRTAFSRYLKDYRSMLVHGHLHGQATQPAPSITNSVGSTRSAAEISREPTLLAAVKHFPKIYGKIQHRLESGDGVRTSFKAEIKDRVNWEITNDEVAIMIKGVAALGASLKTIRGSNCGEKFRGFRVAKCKSRSKQRRTKTSCDLPKTWLSSDEMDTGP
jgi:hypothetical protein